MMDDWLCHFVVKQNKPLIFIPVPYLYDYSIILFSTVIRALEYKRTVTSIPLAEERQILKEIHGIKRTKVQVEEYNKMENQIQSMKVRIQYSTVFLYFTA